jgi:class 3 adenylate cyclase
VQYEVIFSLRVLYTIAAPPGDAQVMKEIVFHYRWEWQLGASPDALWPLVSDTNRFNRATGVPPVERYAATKPGTLPPEMKNRRQLLRLYRLGVEVRWEEEPFEWVRPYRFGVVRRYTTGPVKEMRVLAVMTPLPDGRTNLLYDVQAEPSWALGLVAIPGQIGVLSAFSFASTFKLYGRVISGGGKSGLDLPPENRLGYAARKRLEDIGSRLENEGTDPSLVSRLLDTVAHADDFVLARLRPYALADHWGVSRRDALELCLLATRMGLLDLQWDIVCPLCRGAKASSPTLSGVKSGVHCDTCRLDFVADFDRLIELTFRPNPTIREISNSEWCVGGPQITPHIVAQQLLRPGERRLVTMPLEEGRYRLRTPETQGVQMLSVGSDGQAEATLPCGPKGWSRDELQLSCTPTLHLENNMADEQLFIIERMAWNDQAATAAEVTALQRFRDLFASESLRPGEKIAVGTLTVLFTDLRDSTTMYHRMGDAPAFGKVMSHFDILRDAITEQDGALVKTIGDAVMAVFRRPASAVKAALNAQSRLASAETGDNPLLLKVGIHTGPSIAVTLNDRLDYFGGTVNIASRLEALSSGTDVIISSTVHSDPEVAALLSEPGYEGSHERFESSLRGYDNESFELWRITRHTNRTGD